jgi:ribosomal protein S18 acetylase RimI-like enzyme
MEIRQLVEEDAATYQALRLRALREDPEGFADTYDEAISHPLTRTIDRLRAQDAAAGTFTLGAFDETLVGVVTVVRDGMVKLRHRANIYAMYVVPEARRKGVGQALLTEICTRARQVDGLEQLHLTVVTTNEAARRLYQAMGFVTYGIEPRALKLGDQYWDEDLMVLRLGPS